MTARTRLVAVATMTMACTAVSFAECTDTIVQVNATAQELVDEGFTQVGTGPFQSYPDPDCAALSCMLLAGTSGPMPLKGFFEFQLNDFTYNPIYYNGLFTILNVTYGSSGFTRDILIDRINLETGLTGITAMTPSEATNGAGTCPFTNWLPSELLGAIIFNWNPDIIPETPLSEVYRFAWNLEDLAPPFMGNGLGVDGAYGIPAPGALGLMALAGLLPARRRRS